MSKRDTLQKIFDIGTYAAGAYFVGIAIAGAVKRKREQKAQAQEQQHPTMTTGVGATKSWTLTEDERYSMRDLLGYFVGTLGLDNYEEEIAELQEYRKLITDEEFKILENVEDFLDDDYTYKRFKRSMLDKEERRVLKNFLQWVDDNNIADKLFSRSEIWDFLGASEKVREL